MKYDPETGKPIIEISHSGLNTFASCPRLYAFRKIIETGIDDRGDSDATAVGTAMHEGIQTYMKTRNIDAAIEALALHHPIALRNNTKAGIYSLPASVHTLQRCIEESDLNSYELATFLKDGVEHPAVEIAFLVIIEMEHAIFHLRGFIDLIVRSIFRGNYLPIDIKTTTESNHDILRAKYKWDWQVTSYGVPLNILLGVTGGFETGILNVCMSDKDPSFSLPTYQRGEVDVAAYEYYLFDNCRRIQTYLVDEHFPRNPSNCKQWNRMCSFHAHCGANTIEDMQMLVNPSGLPGDKVERKFEPMFTIKLSGVE